MLDLSMWRRPRVRLVRQTEVAECGLASLAMVANYHGLDVDLGTLRRRFSPSLRGAALKTLINIADAIGLSPRALKLPLENLDGLEMPAILHWNMSHFVVLERVAGKRALIHDPDGRSRWYSLEEVSRHFTGVALELRRGDTFQPINQRERLRLSQLWHRMSGLKRALLQTLVLTLVLQAYVLISPYYIQVAVDSALPAMDHNLLTVLAVGFGLFMLMNVGASLLRSFVLLAAGTQLGFALSINIARHLFRLPVDWFEKRHVGDILSRFQSVAPIQQALTAGPVSALLDGMLALLTLTVMFFYSVSLALIALMAFLIYALVRLVSFSAQREAQESAIVSGAKAQTVMIESVRGITTLRLSNREATRLAVWQSALSEAMNGGVRVLRVGIWQEIAHLLIFGIEGVLAIWIAIGFVIDGGFSIGMVFAYLAYKMQFLDKSKSFVEQGIAFRILGLHLERLSDIALSPEDVSFGPSSVAQTALRGSVELRNIFYRYSPSDPLVLAGVNLVVEPGEHVAITGPSGGGKSTLVKILLGLTEPDSGEMLVDGLPLSRFGHKSYHDQIGAVLQDDSLFAGTIADNIALFDEAPDMTRINEAATAAAIHDDVMAMPMRYDTLTGDMGSALSGGQKQRVLLARALYRRPKLLVMDEGTSHLDAEHEQRVNRAIAELGITRIIIAHRSETIASAERVVVMAKGRLEPRDLRERKPA